VSGTLPLKALLAEFALFVMPLNWFGFFPAKGLIIGQRTARSQPVFLFFLGIREISFIKIPCNSATVVVLIGKSTNYSWATRNTPW